MGAQDLMAAAQPGVLPAARPPLRWRALITQTPRSVWAISALFGLLLALWSVVVPVYDAPDEPQHVDLVRMAAQGLAWPGPDGRKISQQVVASMYATGFSWDPANAFSIDIRPAQPPDAVPRRARPAFNELGPDQPSTYRNQLVQHPPLYYWLSGSVLRLLPGTDGLPADMVVGLLRLFSALFLLPLPVLAAAAARRLLGPGPGEPAAALLPMAVPQFTHIGSVVSNDTLLILAGALLTVVLVYVMTGDTTVRTGLWAGACLSLALWTKGLALALPLWVGLVYLSLLSRRRPPRVVLPALAAAAAMTLPGTVWWLRNLLLHGVLQPRGYEPQIIPDGFTPRFADVVDRFGQQMPQLFWGSFGWVEVDVSTVVVWLASLAVLALTLLALWRARTQAPADTGSLLLLLTPLPLIAGIVLYGAWALYVDIALFTGMQGRYLFPGLTALSVVLAAGLVAITGRLAALAALVLVAVMQAVGLSAALLHWYGPWGVFAPRVSVEAWLGWNPWPNAAVLLLAGLFLVGGLWTLVEVAGVARGRGLLRPAAAGAAGQGEHAPDTIGQREQ